MGHLRHGIAVVNGKGGVGKTSLAAHLAGGAALSGWQTLAVDLDPQGNLAADLGVSGDDGESLRRAIVLEDGDQLAPIPARSGLDVISGGRAALDAWTIVGERGRSGATAALGRLAAVVGPLAEGYDLVVLDTPPASGSVIVDAALAAAAGVVVPVRPDARSLDGLALAASSVGAARAGNVGLTVVGVVVYGLGVGAKAMRRKALAELKAMLEPGGIPVLGTIRDVPKAAVDLREAGQLAHEYESAAANAAPWWQHRRHGSAREPTFSTAAAGLAEDYQLVTEAVLKAVAQLAVRDDAAWPDE